MSGVGRNPVLTGLVLLLWREGITDGDAQLATAIGRGWFEERAGGFVITDRGMAVYRERFPDEAVAV